MLLKGYAIFSLLVTAGFFLAAVSGYRMFQPVSSTWSSSPGVYYGGGGGGRGGNAGGGGGGHGSGGGYHSTWHGGK